MRASEWKAKRAAGRRGGEGSGRRIGREKTDISFAAVELFKKREGVKKPFSLFTKSPRRRGRSDGTKEGGTKGQSRKVAMHACTQRGILSSRASALSESGEETHLWHL